MMNNIKHQILEAFIRDGIMEDKAKNLNEFNEVHPEDTWEYESLEECIIDYQEDENLNEELSGDQTKEYELGDIIFTNSFYSPSSKQTVRGSAHSKGTRGHKIIIITSKKDEDGVIHYRGFALTSNTSDSNKNGGYPNKLHISDYSTILTRGNQDRRDAAINIDDLVKLNSTELSTTGSYKGHVSNEFLNFLQTAYSNVKSGKSNKNMIWDVNNQWNN